MSTACRVTPMLGVIIPQVETWFREGTKLNGGICLSTQVWLLDPLTYDESWLRTNLCLTEKPCMRGLKEILTIWGQILTLLVEEVISLEEIMGKVDP